MATPMLVAMEVTVQDGGSLVTGRTVRLQRLASARAQMEFVSNESLYRTTRCRSDVNLPHEVLKAWSAALKESMTFW